MVLSLHVATLKISRGNLVALRKSSEAQVARIGFHAKAPIEEPYNQGSEAATAEAVRLALGKATKFRLLLVDRGAASCVGTVLNPQQKLEEIKVEPPLSRGEYMVVARLGPECHQSAEDCVRIATETIEELGVDFVDGATVPWPEREADAKTCFATTWQALSREFVSTGLVRALGTDHLETSQLEHVLEVGLNAPSFELLTVSLIEPAARTTSWCHRHGVEVLALLDESHSRRTSVETKIIQSVVESTGIDLQLVHIRWALQNGLVAFPDFASWLEAGVDPKSAEKYHNWIRDFTSKLCATTRHLHSPTELRRTTLLPNAMQALADLDRSTNAAKERFEDFIHANVSVTIQRAPS